MENIEKELSENPWGKYLCIRLKVIKWMTEEKCYTDKVIASKLSMDTEQVRLIKEGYGYRYM